MFFASKIFNIHKKENPRLIIGNRDYSCHKCINKIIFSRKGFNILSLVRSVYSIVISALFSDWASLFIPIQKVKSRRILKKFLFWAITSMLLAWKRHKMLFNYLRSEVKTHIFHFLELFFIIRVTRLFSVLIDLAANLVLNKFGQSTYRWYLSWFFSNFENWLDHSIFHVHWNIWEIDLIFSFITYFFFITHHIVLFGNCRNFKKMLLLSTFFRKSASLLGIIRICYSLRLWNFIRLKA